MDMGKRASLPLPPHPFAREWGIRVRRSRFGRGNIVSFAPSLTPHSISLDFFLDPHSLPLTLDPHSLPLTLDPYPLPLPLTRDARYSKRRWQTKKVYSLWNSSWYFDRICWGIFYRRNWRHRVAKMLLKLKSILYPPDRTAINWRR